MYMGHIGIGLGARRLAPETPLGLLLVAALLPDFVDAISALTTRSQWFQTYSHTLAGISVGAVVIGLAAWLFTRSLLAAIIGASLVVSHLLADFVTSRIQLWRNGPIVGLAVYNHHPLDFCVEGLVIIVGWWIYRGTLSHKKRYHWAVIAILLLLLGFQFVLDGVIGVAA